MTKVLRLHGANISPDRVQDPPVHSSDNPAAYRLAVLPGQFLLPFDISLEVTKGRFAGQPSADGNPAVIVPGVAEAPDNKDHLWIQISPATDQQNWISIEPNATASNLGSTDANKMPSIAHQDVANDQFTSFSFSASTTLAAEFASTTSNTEYKIRFLSHCHGYPNYDEYAVKNIRINGPENKSQLDSKRDNQVVRHQIPRSDVAYSWINKSATRTTNTQTQEAFIGFSGYESSSRHSEKISFLDSSEVGSYTFDLTSGTYGLLNFGRTFGINFDTGSSPVFNEHLDSFLPTDFLGLNSHIVDPIDILKNTQGHESVVSVNRLGSERTTDVNYINDFLLSTHQTSDVLSAYPSREGFQEDTEGSVGMVATLNSIILNRQGPYGWPTFKQIRTGSHPIVRKQKKENLFTFIHHNENLISTKLPALDTSKPTTIMEVKNPSYSVMFEDSFVNRNTSLPSRKLKKIFSTNNIISRPAVPYGDYTYVNFKQRIYPRSSEVGSSGLRSRENNLFPTWRKNKGIRSRATELVTYESLTMLTHRLSRYRDGTVPDPTIDVSIRGQYGYRYGGYLFSAIWPLDGSANLKKDIASLYATVPDNNLAWVSTVPLYKDTHDLHDLSRFGGNITYRKLFRNHALTNIDLDGTGSNPLGTPAATSNQADPLLTVGVLMGDKASSFIPRVQLSYSSDVSESKTREESLAKRNLFSKISYSETIPIFKTMRDIIYGVDEDLYHKIEQSAEKVNNALGPSGQDLGYSKTFSIREVDEALESVIDSNETRGYFFANVLAGNNQKWTAPMDHPIGGPNYNTYDEFMVDVRPLAKDYSIVPEFRIHNFINQIINSPLPPNEVMKKSTAKNVFEIPMSLDPQAVSTTLSDKITESEYGINDSPILDTLGESETLDIPVLNHKGDKATTDFWKTYSTTDLLNVFDLIESEGLDPTTRRVTLRASAIKKFMPYEGFYPAERTAELVTHFASSYYGQFTADQDNLDPSEAHNPWMKALFSPGILYNTIKSSLAVDYPVFTKEYKVAPISPYVVNYRQVGVSPMDYEYEVGPLAFAESRVFDDGVAAYHGRNYNHYTVNDSPYRPIQGMAFIDPPVHNYMGSFDYPAGLGNVSNLMQYLSQDAHQGYNSDPLGTTVDPADASNDVNFTGSTYGNTSDAVFKGSVYGRALTCGNIYSPYYYKKYYTNQLDEANTEYSGSFPSPVRYALGGLDEESSFDYRIPFEAVIDPDIVPQGLKIFNHGAWHQESYLDVSSVKSRAKNDEYRLAANNFFAESIEFFLKGGKLTKFTSESDADASFGLVTIPKKGYQYKMRLILMKDPIEAQEALGLEDSADYLDVVSSIAPRYHTGEHYEYEEDEANSVTFRKFLIDYFDKWDYKKGSTYDTIKQFHNLEDIDIMGLSCAFHNSVREIQTSNVFAFSALYEAAPASTGFHAHGPNGRNWINGTMSMNAFFEPGPRAGSIDLLVGEHTNIHWLNDWTTPSIDDGASVALLGRGPFNLVRGDSYWAGGCEFTIFRNDRGSKNYSQIAVAQNFGAGAGVPPYEQYEPWNGLKSRRSNPKYTLVTDKEIRGGAANQDWRPQNLIWDPPILEHPVGSALNFETMRNVYIETDEAFWISPPTTVRDLLANQDFETRQNGITLGSNSPARTENFGTPKILTKALSMKGLRYQKQYALPIGNPPGVNPPHPGLYYRTAELASKPNYMTRYQYMATRGVTAYYPAGPTIGNILDTNDLYAPLYEFNPFNINLLRSFVESGSRVTSNSNLATSGYRSRNNFVMYNNKAAFGPPCVSIEGWNTLHFPHVPQTHPGNSTALLPQGRPLYSNHCGERPVNKVLDFHTVLVRDLYQGVQYQWTAPSPIGDPVSILNDGFSGKSTTVYLENVQRAYRALLGDLYTHRPAPRDTIGGEISSFGTNPFGDNTYSSPFRANPHSSVPWYYGAAITRTPLPGYIVSDSVFANTGIATMMIGPTSGQHVDIDFVGFDMDFESGEEISNWRYWSKWSARWNSFPFMSGSWNQYSGFPWRGRPIGNFTHLHNVPQFQKHGAGKLPPSAPGPSEVGLFQIRLSADELYGSIESESMLYDRMSFYWQFNPNPGVADTLQTNVLVRSYEPWAQYLAGDTITPSTLRHGIYTSVTKVNGTPNQDSEGNKSYVPEFLENVRYMMPHETDSRYKFREFFEYSSLNNFTGEDNRGDPYYLGSHFRIPGVTSDLFQNNDPNVSLWDTDYSWTTLEDNQGNSDEMEMPFAFGIAPRKPYLPQSSEQVLSHNNTLFDDHHYVGFMEPLVSYDFRPFTPAYYEGYAYAEYVFTPERQGKHTLEEILSLVEVHFHRKRDLVKYANAVETEGWAPNYWHNNIESGLMNPDTAGDSSYSVETPERYKYFLNPNNMKKQHVGSLDFEFVKVFPRASLIGDYSIGHGATGTSTDILSLGPITDSLSPADALSIFNNYENIVLSDSSLNSSSQIKKNYADTTEEELMTNLPNKLKYSGRKYFFRTLTGVQNDITYPRIEKYESVDNVITAVHRGVEIDIRYPFEIFFGESEILTWSPKQYYTSEHLISARSELSGQSKFRADIPIEDVFVVGSSVSVYTTSFSDDLIGQASESGMPAPAENWDYENESEQYHVTFSVLSVNPGTKSVTFQAPPGQWLTNQKELKELTTAKTRNNMAELISSRIPHGAPHKLRLSSGATWAIRHPVEHVDLGDYGYVPRTCGLDYPVSDGFLVNESTWNRLNPHMIKVPMFVDRNNKSLKLKPLTDLIPEMAEDDNDPPLENQNVNLGYFYDKVDLKAFLKNPMDHVTAANGADGNIGLRQWIMADESVVNWRVQPLLTECIEPSLRGVRIPTHAVAALEDTGWDRTTREADTTRPNFQNQEDCKLSMIDGVHYPVYSPTTQGDTSFLFYRYNNRVDARKATNHISEMTLEASFNLLGVDNVNNLEFDSSGGIVAIKKDSNLGSRWVISPKFEAPVLDFSKWTERNNRHIVEIGIPELRSTAVASLEGLNNTNRHLALSSIKFNLHGPAFGIWRDDLQTPTYTDVRRPTGIIHDSPGFQLTFKTPNVGNTTSSWLGHWFSIFDPFGERYNFYFRSDPSSSPWPTADENPYLPGKNIPIDFTGSPDHATMVQKIIEALTLHPETSGLFEVMTTTLQQMLDGVLHDSTGFYVYWNHHPITTSQHRNAAAAGATGEVLKEPTWDTSNEKLDVLNQIQGAHHIRGLGFWDDIVPDWNNLTSADLKLIRQTFANELQKTIKDLLLYGKGDYSDCGGSNWLEFDEDYPDIDSLVILGENKVTVVGPPAKNNEFNKVKFKVVNARLPSVFENGYGGSELGFLDVKVVQEAGSYVYADRIEPENYKRRDIDIIPDPIIGMWHQEGSIPTSGQGLTMLLADSPSEFENKSPAEAVIKLSSFDSFPGHAVVLKTHDGEMETYIHQNNANPAVSLTGTVEGIEGSVYGVDMDNPTPGLPEESAYKLVKAINGLSKYFKASNTGSEVFITTRAKGAIANSSEVSVVNNADQLYETLVIIKQFSGGGQSVSSVGSLADLVGFKKNIAKPLGRLADSKRVKEAVLAIPTKGGIRTSFYPVERALVEKILSTSSASDLEGIPASLIAMINIMKQYVLPPHLDFITNKSIDPFLVYPLEFEHEFTKQDLADIWQNLYPRDSANADIGSSSFSHDIADFPSFNLSPQTRWMVFKVKQKAQKNYFNKVSRSIKDMAMQIKSSDLNSLSDVQQEPDYSYNWPYDYFSLIELFKMDAEVNLTNGEIPTFEEYMDVVAKTSSTDTADPQELKEMVERASSQRSRAREEARAAALREAARARRAEQKRVDALYRSRADTRPVFRWMPEGTPYIVDTRGRRITLSVDSEGGYHYMATRDKSEEEIPAGRNAQRVYKVTVIPSSVTSEGMRARTSEGYSRQSNRTAEGYPPEG